MNENAAGNNESGKSKAVGNLLDGRTSRAQSGRSNVRAAVIVNNDTDDDIDDGNDTLADHDRASVEAGLSHLRGNGEETGGSSVSEDEGADGGDSVLEGGGVGDLVIGLPDGTLGDLGSGVGLGLNTDSDGDSEDGSHDTEDTNPGNPGDTAESLDTSESGANNSSNGNESSSTHAMSRESVEGN